MGCSKHRVTSTGRRNRVAVGASCLRAALLGVALILGVSATAHAQGAVRSVHGDWQIRCDTPPGAQSEQWWPKTAPMPG